MLVVSLALFGAVCLIHALSRVKLALGSNLPHVTAF